MVTNEIKQTCSRRYLSHIRDIKKVLSYKRERVSRIRSRLEPVAITYGDKITTSIVVDKLETLSAKKDELIRECIDQECLYIDELRIALRAISQIEDYYAQEVLNMYYVDCMTQKEICNKMNISRTTQHNYHVRGLIMLYEYIPEVDKYEQK